MRKYLPSFVAAALVCTQAWAQVVINEIQYHPVEHPHFDANGNQTYADTNLPSDTSSDVHEFVELQNAGAAAVDLSGWKLAGGIDFTFPAGTTIVAGGYRVIALNPARIASVYGLVPATILGPYTGTLSNNGDTVRLEDAGANPVDSVSYSPAFPWAISANALGTGDDFTGLDSAAYEYKGRSLQRVSVSGFSNDPANWVAVRPPIGATFADLPTPGAENIVTRAAPKPVVVAISAAQLTDNAPIIRASVQVKVTCTFSSLVSLANVQVEYFVDNMNAFGETRNTVTMTALGNGQYSATLPGQVSRSIVRYRIKANRGDGVELVAPRADDPAVVQVGAPTYQASPPKRLPAAREAWFLYFVTPVRTSPKPVYDVIVPTDGSTVDDSASTNTTQFNGINGFQAMAYDCKGSPKRTTAENTASSYPRETPYVLPTDRVWNDTVPAVMVTNGIAHDIQIRMHGSRWNRRPGRKSFKVFFTDYDLYKDGAGNLVSSLFETDKSDFFLTAHGLNQAANLPLSTVRWVDWYFNNDTVIQRVEQGEYNGELLDAYAEKNVRLNPGSVKEAAGEYYKSVGFICNDNLTGEGPYGNGNAWPLPASGFWTELQRIDYTYTLQNHPWKGAAPMRDLINGMWTARGDRNVANPLTNSAPFNPNIPNTKTWLQTNWDVDAELTSISLSNWMCPWDDTTQNHFFWRRANGKWVRLLWDFDGEYGAGGPTATSSIYNGEVNDTANNFRGPNYFKDSFIKAYRTEYKQRLWFLNNTLLEPENLQTLTYPTSTGGTNTYYAFINAQSGGFALNRFNSVNTQCALGIFYKPRRPTNTLPANAAPVLPGASLTSSAYLYDAAFTHTAASVISPHTSSKWEIRPASSTYDYPAYIGTSTANKTSLPIPFAQLVFGQTYYWRVTYYDADGHPSITSAETSFSYGPTSTIAGNISLNEVMAENHTAVTNGGTYPDYVELRNNTAGPIDIGGWTLTDDDYNLIKYVFPGGTTVPANGYIVVWCDSAAAVSGLHSGFALDSDGQRVLLLQGGVIRDVITFGPQAVDLSIGRIVDGTGSWALNIPTPGATNLAKTPLGAATSLKVNEWMANPASGSDWFELYNPDANPVALGGLYLSDTPGTPTISQIPPLSFIAGKGFAKISSDGSAAGFNHANFKLSSGGSPIVLTNANGTSVIDSVTFGAQVRNVSQGRFPDGAATVASFPQSASKAYTNWLPGSILINEALANSIPPQVDTIELFNPTGSPVDVSGWWLSDDRFVPQKYQIPAGTIMAAGGYLVLDETQFNPTPGATSNFSLDSFGEEITLTATAGGVPTGYRAQVSFGTALDGVSFGRIVTANAALEFWPLTARTFGSANAAPAIGPVIINDIHYHPPDLAGLDNGRDEFVELHNITSHGVDLTGWRLKGASDFVFVPGTILRPGDYILVAGFNPTTDLTSLAAFRAALSVPVSVPIYGPFAPKLANDTASVELAYPGALVGGVTPYINVDRVEYADFAPWPVSPDGSGSSLQRESRTVIGNDPGNWASGTPTPGAKNFNQSAITDNDDDGIPNGWEDANGFDKFNAADAAQDADGDDQSNIAEYLAGTDPHSGASFLAATVTKIAGGFRVQFTAQVGKGYTIQYRDSLTSGAWLRLADIAALPTTQATAFDNLTAVAQRYYRVVTPTVP